MVQLTISQIRLQTIQKSRPPILRQQFMSIIPLETTAPVTDHQEPLTKLFTKHIPCLPVEIPWI